MNTATHSLKFLLLMVAVFFSACQVEDLPPIKESAKTGCIILSVPEVQLYTECGTRAAATISDYTYKLNSVEGSTHVVSDSTITFSDGAAIIPAGIYTLTATSKTAQDAGPWYQGTSSSFSLLLGKSQTVEILLGKPKNVEIAVSFTDGFKALYENYSITIGSNTLTSNGNLYAMPDADGKVSYTIKGSAKQGSHVSDIPTEGITGKLDVAAGNSYPLNITASSISDLLIQIGEGTHNGEFDTKEHHLF